MSRHAGSGRGVAGWALAWAGAVGLCGCHGSGGESAAPAPKASALASVRTPLSGEAVRVGGDLSAEVTGSDGNYRCSPCSIDTPLPEGYPKPTAPGAIEIKTYPGVRLAQVEGTGNPDAGMNRAFWPLFNHIKGHGIAMTSPVEMNYRGMDDTADQASAQPESWTMAFLYRKPDMNAVGTEGKVEVRDAAPVTVVAVGLKGDYSLKLVRRGMEDVEAWLGAHREWKAAGEWRALYYNGPSLMFWNKWAEVQLPVRPAEEATR